ncbi:MAG TPA: DUF433 domain-containing protein [Longimicrobium sp.]|nr:DUF433 domain-containing protein [Longimicrobium sp.]
MKEEYIVRDGDTGRAIVSSTGTPVDEILESIAAGGDFADVLRRHPELTPGAVVAAVQFAKVAVGREVQYLPRPDPGFTGVRERAAVAFNGRGEGTVTLESGEYDDLLYRLDLFEGIFEAERDLDEGNGIPHEAVFAQLRNKFGG